MGLSQRYYALLLSLALNTQGYALTTDKSLSGDWLLHSAYLVPADVYLPQSSVHHSPLWQKIQIPNNWYLAGYDLSGAVWHKRLFDVDSEQQNSTARLNFQAIDYAADVWLNGHYLGFHQGYFDPFSFDVTGLLQAKDNLLVVKVDSPNEMPDKEWSLHKKLIKGVLNHHDTRPAGAWSIKGQDANSGGIWQPVTLHFSKNVSIENIVVKQQIAKGVLAKQLSTAQLDIGIELNTILPLQHLQTQIILTDEHSQQRQDYWLDTAQCTAITKQKWHCQLGMTVSNVNTWWPKGYGAAALYQLNIAIKQEGKILEQAKQRLAFRTITYDAANNAFLINGRRLFIKGTNYIASPWLASMNRDSYARDIDLMQDAHINAVRVHAHIAGQDFYDIADEKGMLVWQDFPLQWGYDDSETFTEEAQRQARRMIELLHPHPSIFAWSGRNEPPWNADWMKYKYPDYNPQQNRDLTAKVGAVLATDSTRYHHDYSATGEHLWMGWYSGNWRDHAKRTKVSIVS
ncbi:MAG: hypothetical protein H6996_06380 [Moraxellaceae bacterium]|nr:hypothetical protein [Moraxellaceae bacterium]MCP5176524.1 hypothetical protein [Moraxellaceae bacterium]